MTIHPGGYLEAQDHVLILLAHMACADEQIHDREVEQIQEAADKLGVGPGTLQVIKDIFSQAEDAVPVTTAVRSVPESQRKWTLQMLARMVWADGSAVDRERELVDRVSRAWRFDETEVATLLEKEEEAARARHPSESTERSIDSELSFGARFLKKIDAIAGQQLTDKIADLAPPPVKDGVERYRRELLLSGPEYDEAIRRCAFVSADDYRFAEAGLNSALDTLRLLRENLNAELNPIQESAQRKKATAAKQAVAQLESTRGALDGKILNRVERLRSSLRAKRRSLDSFTIAFMGKTKSGKSTLHAVVTGEGSDAISVGRQRTTRYNRVYHWKNVRIIDTPGIGAPGANADTAIAESVIDEADVICYIVTNDSQQETEFQFLKLLRDRLKPLIILLNVKHNLRHQRKLERFLSNPDGLLRDRGQNSLEGHLNRIRRYARQHYANDYFEIVPVQLLAALMSRETEHQSHARQLRQASKVWPFLDKLRFSILENGPLRRSQTLLGGTAGDIHALRTWISEQSELYARVAEAFSGKEKAVLDQIRTAGASFKAEVRMGITAVFNSAKATIRSFAEDHWSNKQAQLKSSWNRQLDQIRFQERLDQCITSARTAYTGQVEEIFDEVGQELQMIARLQAGGLEPEEQDSNTVAKNILRWGGNIALVGGVIVAGVFPPAALAAVVGVVANLLSKLFKSKKQKREDAVSRLTSNLRDKLEEQQSSIQKAFLAKIDTEQLRVLRTTKAYFGMTVGGLSEVSGRFAEASDSLDREAENLNAAFATRIIDWLEETTARLDKQRINERIDSVDRSYGERIAIRCRNAVSTKRSSDVIHHVLQEDVSIHPEARK